MREREVEREGGRERKGEERKGGRPVIVEGSEFQ